MSAGYEIALVKWEDVPGDCESAIEHELAALGHRVRFFRFDAAVPGGVDVVFSFAGFRRFLQIPRALDRLPREARPTFVHWNTEGLVNVRVPYGLASAAGAVRSWIGRAGDRLERMRGLMRFGDIRYAARRGWLDVLADTSAIFAERFRSHGIPVVHAPFGTSPLWHEDLGLERDVDVLWMGMRGTRRRATILSRLAAELAPHGVRFHLADGVRSPFVFGRDRTRMLNRAKITLNVTREWWCENSLRFTMAAPNRSLIVSEEILPHCPAWVPGTHFVASPVDRLAETILHHLRHEEPRRGIVENAYRLATTDATFASAVGTIMEAVREKRERAA